MVIYVRKDHPIGFRNLASLRGKRIGVVRGWSYGRAFDRMRADGEFWADEAASDAVNFRRLVVMEEIDCVLAAETAGEILIRKLGYDELIVREHVPFGFLDVHVVSAKKANKKDIVRRFDASLEKMKSDGTYRRLVGRFLGR